jgi:hypothetical protein
VAQSSRPVRATARRPARGSLAKAFAADPLAAVLTVLREAGPDRELRAEEVKAALLARGVPGDRLHVWRRLQERLVADDRVGVGGDRYRRTYRWLPEPPPPSPAQALALLAGHRLPAQRRAQLVEIVQAVLPEVAGPLASPAGDRTALARLEQREKDAVRALAEMAIEVEELATNEASARALVHTVRALTKLAELRPIERAGEMTCFDRARHSSVGGKIMDGAPVLVLRPGYTWNRPDGEVLIARAVVQDRSPS